MKAAPPPRSSIPPPSTFDGSRALLRVRRLIYFYLILIVLEGALRKWAVPQLSNPLLIIRDPVAILIYFAALRSRCFPRNAFFFSLAIIAVLSWVLGFVVLIQYVPVKTSLLVTAFGFRSNFLHLPLIFIMASVFDLEDVKRIGWWTIAGLVPMALLMALQFRASPDAFINRVAGVGEGTQILSSGGKIRPPGPFSFISGAIFYLSAGTSFLLHAFLAKLPYKSWLLYLAGVSLVVGVAVSGSRGAVLAVGLVVASLLIILLARPDLMTSIGRNILVAAVLLWVLSYVPFFRHGVSLLSERFTESAEIAETTVVGGLATRTISGFTEGLSRIPEAPLSGWGLGIGTNGGSAFLMGHSMFLLSENEWTRIVFESGPILGVAFLLWRVILAWHLLLQSWRALRAGNTLPIFLFSAGFFAVLNAPLGQPTSAGFAVIFAGLCLAATRTAETAAPAEPELRSVPPPRMGRSHFAARLHGPAPDHPNGSVDW
jgi:hypothetical protein